jgi:hypothetical protein
VAELVDARDLKFFAAFDVIALFWKTPAPDTMENDGTKRDLENAPLVAPVSKLALRL